MIYFFDGEGQVPTDDPMAAPAPEGEGVPAEGQEETQTPAA